MASEQDDWSSWIITTIMAALSTMVGTVVFLAKLIETKYLTEIRELKEEFKTYRAYADNHRHELEVRNEKCMEEHHQAEIRLAKLEAITKP